MKIGKNVEFTSFKVDRLPGTDMQDYSIPLESKNPLSWQDGRQRGEARLNMVNRGRDKLKVGERV
jgi:hypothetical protein